MFVYVRLNFYIGCYAYRSLFTRCSIMFSAVLSRVVEGARAFSSVRFHFRSGVFRMAHKSKQTHHTHTRCWGLATTTKATLLHTLQTSQSVKAQMTLCCLDLHVQHKRRQQPRVAQTRHRVSCLSFFFVYLLRFSFGGSLSIALSGALAIHTHRREREEQAFGSFVAAAAAASICGKRTEMCEILFDYQPDAFDATAHFNTNHFGFDLRIVRFDVIYVWLGLIFYAIAAVAAATAALQLHFRWSGGNGVYKMR